MKEFSKCQTTKHTKKEKQALITRWKTTRFTGDLCPKTASPCWIGATGNTCCALLHFPDSKRFLLLCLSFKAFVGCEPYLPWVTFDTQLWQLSRLLPEKGSNNYSLMRALAPGNHFPIYRASVAMGQNSPKYFSVSYIYVALLSGCRFAGTHSCINKSLFSSKQFSLFKTDIGTSWWSCPFLTL